MVNYLQFTTLDVHYITILNITIPLSIVLDIPKSHCESNQRRNHLDQFVISNQYFVYYKAVLIVMEDIQLHTEY